MVHTKPDGETIRGFLNRVTQWTVMDESHVVVYWKGHPSEVELIDARKHWKWLKDNGYDMRGYAGEH